MHFLIHPKGWIDDKRMVKQCLESGCIGLYKDISFGLHPRETSRASRNLLVIRDVQPDTSLSSAVYVFTVNSPRREPTCRMLGVSRLLVARFRCAPLNRKGIL